MSNEVRKKVRLSRAFHIFRKLLRSVFKLTERYLTWALLFVPIVSLIVASPVWPRHVKLEAQNPIVIVDTPKFGKNVLRSVSNGVISASTFRALSTALNIDPSTGWGDRIVFFRNWHAAKDPTAEIHESMRSYSKQEMDVGFLKLVKEQLGYEDLDTKPRTITPIARAVNEHITSREVMKSMPDTFLHQELFRAGWVKENEFFGLGSVGYGGDPFYQFFENSTGGKEKLALYGALRSACSFISWFTLINNGKKDAYDIRITSNVDLEAIDKDLMASYDIRVGDQLRSGVSLTVPVLRPGDEHFKLIVFPSHKSLVREAEVRLDDKPFIEEVSEYWVWLLLVPLLPALAERLLKLGPWETKPNS